MAKVSLDDETADSAFLHGTPPRLKPDAICSNCSRPFPIDSPCLLQVNLEGRSAVETVLHLIVFRVCGHHWHSPRPTGPRQAREAEGMKADALISMLATDPTAVDASAVTRRICAAAAAGPVLQRRANDYPSTSPRLAPVINANSPQAANSVGHPLTCIPMRLGSRANLIKVHIASGSCRLSST